MPLLVRAPHLAASRTTGAECSWPVEWFDIGPTLVELAGGEVDYEQFGCSLVPVLKEPSVSHRQEAISEIGGEIMLLNQQWKIAVNRQGEAYLLFHVENDPDEVDNLAGQSKVRQVESDLRLRILERLVRSQKRRGRESR